MNPINVLILTKLERDKREKHSKSDAKYYSNLRPITQIRYKTLKTDYTDTKLIKRADLNLIKQNFNYLLLWVNKLTSEQNIGYDLELLVSTLFCKLCKEFVREQKSFSKEFFENYSTIISNLKQDSFTKDFIKSHGSDNQYYSNHKFNIKLCTKSNDLLKQFLTNFCDVKFLLIVYEFFEIKLVDDVKAPIKSSANKTLDPVNVNGFLHIDMSNTQYELNCGKIIRNSGLVIYNRKSSNYIHIKSLNECTNERKILSKHTDRIYALDYFEKDSLIATVSADKNVQLHKLNQNITYTGTGHLGSVYCVKISRNGKYIGTGSEDNTARLWTTAKCSLKHTFDKHKNAVTSIDFHPNCQYVASGSADSTISMWCTKTGQSMRIFHGFKGIVHDIKFNPNGQTLISSSADCKIYIWNIREGNIQNELKTDNIVTNLIYNKCGSRICCGTIDGNIQMWKLHQDKCEVFYNKVLNKRILDLYKEDDSFAALTT